MKPIATSVFAVALVAMASMAPPRASSASPTQPDNDSANIAVQKGLKWLVAVQGHDGGWGQDGGETSFIRVNEHLESNGNDVANTAVATLALIHAGSTPTSGPYRAAVNRGLDFVLRSVEQSPEDGLAITSVTGSQIQRKLGPCIDTFLTSMLLSEVDGNLGDARTNARVRRALEKCVRKIEHNQLRDGSWNIAGGWAPILGTSMASRSLFVAQQKGVKVEPVVMARVDEYTKNKPQSGAGGGVGAGEASGIGGGVYRVGGRPVAMMASPEAAGVPLYDTAQALEQLSRTEKDRAKNAPAIKAMRAQLADARVVSGFGSMGGEEFFSYLNVSDSLRRAGGDEWKRWNGQIKARLVKLQNDDGTWAGQHCITGRVAVTSAAILTLYAERDPMMPSSAKSAKN